MFEEDETEFTKAFDTVVDNILKQL